MLLGNRLLPLLSIGFRVEHRWSYDVNYVVSLDGLNTVCSTNGLPFYVVYVLNGFDNTWCLFGFEIKFNVVTFHVQDEWFEVCYVNIDSYGLCVVMFGSFGSRWFVIYGSCSWWP